MRRKQEEMRGLCSCARAPRALVLAAVLVVSSCSYVAHGVRTTPSGRGTGSAGAGRLDEAEQTTSGHKPHHQAAALHRNDPAAGAELVARERAASGSRLPDCTHACGACSPCRRVMVSFRCAESASESCPIAYRCMCRGRFFHVPSL